MTLHFEDSLQRLYCGDARHMDALEDGSIQCVVTSPPYWGLRKYAGVPDLIWGGDAECEHEWGDDLASRSRDEGFKQWGNDMTAGKPPPAAPSISVSQGAFCQCGAWRGSYGLEPTPEMYVDHTIEVLREVRRVLRDDGVVFWNIGDSYAANRGSGAKSVGEKQATNAGSLLDDLHVPPGLKPKDLVLIPFRVALAAQADGWWVRSIIIWDKANPMPESVRDRPTTSHEYIIMLTKSARYYWDAEAVREPQTGGTHSRTGSDVTLASYQDARGSYHDYRSPSTVVPGGRNVRSVWSFPSQPYPDAHFATFPEALPERCIKAASKEGDTILDPFAGSGTTLWVAKRLGRKSVGYELSLEYCELAVDRNRQAALAL